MQQVEAMGEEDAAHAEEDAEHGENEGEGDGEGEGVLQGCSATAAWVPACC